MKREPHVRFCERAVVRFRRATHLIIGFEYESDARRFLGAMRERLGKFALSLHPEKTRLIEFGRSRPSIGVCVAKKSQERLISWARTTVRTSA